MFQRNQPPTERTKAIALVEVLVCVSMNLGKGGWGVRTRSEREKERESTHCIFILINHTLAVYVILPRAKIELSSVNGARPYNSNMQ